MRALRNSAYLVGMLAVTACGGGGGGGSSSPPGSITFSTDQLVFTTSGPWDTLAVPASQTLSATVQGVSNGTLYVIIQVNNPELVSVGNVVITGETSGQALVTAANPATIGIGEHSGTLVIRACVNDPQCNSNQLSGSPKTISIAYRVPSNVDGDTVSPRVVPANAAGTLILRGRGFTSGSTVAFAGVPATSVNVVSSSEIRASYPPLVPNNYPVSVSSGSIAFSGTVTAVPPAIFQPAFLSYPTSTDTFIWSLEYDEERKALLVASAPGSDSPVLMRYQFESGSWASPIAVPMSGIRQVRLSRDGTRLLVLRSQDGPVETFMDEVDPVTLATEVSTPLVQTRDFVYGTSFALANDGNAILATRLPGSGFAQQYLYATGKRQFIRLPGLADSYATLASPDGSFVALLGSSTLVYDSSVGRLHSAAPVNAGFERGAPSSELSGARFQSGTGVFDRNFQPVGYAPGSHIAAVINRAGTRLYTFFPGDASQPTPKLFVYDLTVPAVAGDARPRLQQVGEALDLPGDPGNSSPGPQMTITPDGNAVFIAGYRGIAVVPTP